jgi:hypothetical protein
MENIPYTKKTAKLNSKKWKKYSFSEEKSLVGLTPVEQRYVQEACDPPLLVNPLDLVNIVFTSEAFSVDSFWLHFF